jgi:hypothetical protein
MSRGLRGLGSSGLGSPSSSSNPPSQNTGSETNIPLGITRGRLGGQPGNVFIPNATNILNTPIRPGVSPQIPNINTFETTDQQPRHVRALESTHSTNPPELGRKTVSSITRNPSPTKRKPKLTPAEKARRIEEKTRLINENAIKFRNENPGAKQKAEEELSAERSARAISSDYATHARSQTKQELLKQLPKGDMEIAKLLELDRDEVKLRIDLVKNQHTHSTPQTPPNVPQNPPEEPLVIPRQPPSKQDNTGLDF